MASNHWDIFCEYRRTEKNEHDRRGFLGKYFIRNCKQRKIAKINKFATEGMNKTVVYGISQRLQINKQVDLKMNEVIPGNTTAQKVCNKIKMQIKHHVGISLKELTQKFKFNQMSVCTTFGEGNLSDHKH